MRENAINAARAKSGQRSRGTARERTVAQANETVAWPEGNEYVDGASRRGSGTGRETGGRSRSTQSLSAPDMLSARRIAAPTRVHNQGRLHEKPEIATASRSQTIPNDPIRERPSKRGSTKPTRWSTTHPWRLRSSPPNAGT
jgi:hypothetical protein